MMVPIGHNVVTKGYRGGRGKDLRFTIYDLRFTIWGRNHEEDLQFTIYNLEFGGRNHEEDLRFTIYDLGNKNHEGTKTTK